MFLLGRLLRGCRGVDLPDELSEDVIDTELELCRHLEEDAVVEALGKLLTLGGGDDTRVVEIALVADKNHGDVLRVLHTEDLLAHVAEIVEATKGHNRVHKHKALTVLHVEITHGGELLGTRSIENLEHALLAVDLALLSVGIFDGGIVLLDKDTLHEENGDGRFADTTTTKDNKLIFFKRHYLKNICICLFKKKMEGKVNVCAFFKK